MTGNVSKSKGFKGDAGKDGYTPSITFRYDEATGDLYYSSDGLLIDKEYVDSEGLAKMVREARALSSQAFNGQNILSDKFKEMEEYIEYVGVRSLNEAAKKLFDGAILNKGQEYTLDTKASVTDFIEVEVGARVEIDGAYLSGNRAICGYDINKQFVECFATNTTDTECVIESVPDGVKYIRITCPRDFYPSVLQVNLLTKADLDTKVDKVDGKGLSTNDYTDEEKEKVKEAFEAAQAQVKTTLTEEQLSVEYGSELVKADGWVTDGWSGNLADGFTHTAGNTNPLVFQMPEATGTKLYQITFKSSVDMTTNNLYVTLGGSDAFELYGNPYRPSIGLGIRSVQDGNLEFIPSSTFTGTISEISVKEIIGGVDGVLDVVDNEGKTVFEVRATKADETESGICGTNNVFSGINVGRTNTSGVGNVGFGVNALMNNTSGFWNVGVGYKTLKDNTAGSRNIGIGYIALGENVTGTRNVAIGTFALNHNKKGYKNIAIGADSQDKNIDGYCNVAVGVQSLYANENGFYNVAIGDSALVSAKSNYNTGVGYRALAGCTTGSNNVALGYQAGVAITTGSSNLAIGTNALYKLKTGQNNIGIGSGSGRGQNASSGFKQGIFIGNNAGYNLADNADYNIMIGYQAGHTTTSGTNNILIGKDAYAPTETQSNWLNIGGLVQGRMGTNAYARIDGALEVANLPTSDPNIAGRLWNDNGTVKVSAG